MPIRSRRLTDEEKRVLLKLDEDRLSERDALAFLAQASRAREPFEIRGVKFPLTKFRWRKTRFISTSFVDCDLGSPFVTWRPFTRRRFDQCRFHDVSMDGLHLARCEFRQCSFERVIFGKELHGYLGNCLFEDCTFDGCTFSYVGLDGCALVRCTVERAGGTHVRHDRCRVRDTKFSGRYGAVHFFDSSLDNVDFSACDLGEAVFLSNEYRRVRLPETQHNYFVTSQTLEEFLPVVEERFSPEGAECFRAEAKIPGLHSVSREFFEEFNGLEKSLLNEFLYPRRVRGDFTLEPEA